MYWHAEHDNLLDKWIDNPTPIEQFQIYKGISPTLKYMARSILHRYFNVNSSLSESYVQEVIDHVLVKVINFDKDKGAKWYSYCQALIRNYYISELTSYKNSKKEFHKSMAKIEDQEFLSDNLHDNRDDYGYELDMYDNLKKRFIQMREKLKTHVFNEFVAETGNTRMKLIAELYINCCIEYLEKFGVEINFLALSEYISNNIKYSDYHLSICSRYFFGLASTPSKNFDIDSRTIRPKDNYGEAMVKNKYVNDDICPNYIKLNYNHRFRNKNKVLFEYF